MIDITDRAERLKLLGKGDIKGYYTLKEKQERRERIKVNIEKIKKIAGVK
jgi:hypothetical protein